MAFCLVLSFFSLVAYAHAYKLPVWSPKMESHSLPFCLQQSSKSTAPHIQLRQKGGNFTTMTFFIRGVL